MPVMPLVTALRNPGMRARHWDQLSNEIGMDVHPENDPDFTIQTAFDMGLHKHGALVARVGATAGKEYQIEKGLDKMLAEWKDTEVRIKYTKPSGDEKEHVYQKSVPASAAEAAALLPEDASFVGFGWDRLLAFEPGATVGWGARPAQPLGNATFDSRVRVWMLRSREARAGGNSRARFCWCCCSRRERVDIARVDCSFVLNHRWR